MSELKSEQLNFRAKGIIISTFQEFSIGISLIICTSIITEFIFALFQVINFAVVPPAYRVVYIASAAFFWTVIMSYLKNQSEM